MDLDKQLAKFSKKEVQKIIKILKALQDGDLYGLHLKKLSGKKDLYRVRSGSIRILYQRIKKNVFILKIERRSKGTYRNL